MEFYNSLSENKLIKTSVHIITQHNTLVETLEKYKVRTGSPTLNALYNPTICNKP